MLAQINANLMGRDAVFDTPFGSRQILYADYTASGRGLKFIEDYIQQKVLPFYGNTHTTTSITGVQTTGFRDEARDIIAKCVNAKSTGHDAEDCVIFTGSGSTGAVNKVLKVLGLDNPWKKSSNKERPVVFVGPFEHHSNLLPWRESGAEVIIIRENELGQVDTDMLKKLLIHYADRTLKIGSFGAASNVTGIITNVNEISALLHQHGALSFWDYATCAPYIDIDMNPNVSGELGPFVYKDAVFLSGHKFVGGPGTPGVLIIKKKLLNNAVPTNPGGGTVLYVTKEDHYYLSNKIEREEGGTPEILGSIRLGLAFDVIKAYHGA